MNSHDKTRPLSPHTKLEEAIKLAKLGHKAEAGEMFRSIVALQPVNQAAWLWLSAVTMNQAEAEAALAQAKHINPAHPAMARAEQWFVHRFSSSPSTKKNKTISNSSASQSSKTKTPKKLWAAFNPLAFGLAVLAVLMGLSVLFWGLLLEVSAAVQPVNEVNHTRQDDAIIVDEAAENKLSQDYIQKGLALRDKGFIEEAVTNFEQALELTPTHTQAQHELYLASAYLAGTQHYQAGQWQEAITELEIVWTESNAYPHVQDLLYSAYYNLGLSRQAAGELPQAKAAIQAAIALHPELSAPHHLIAEIEFAMAPKTPPVTAPVPVPVDDKLIVVGLAEQRMVVYEGGWQVFDFIVSTGEPGRETAIGEFEIQNKIDMAYASTWNLDMPYWMGIYWAGPLQNGIHSLPIVKHTGQKLWDGYLGQRVSYGCIILGDDDAATLYDWAEVGVKVKIVPSLADWSPES